MLIQNKLQSKIFEIVNLQMSRLPFRSQLIALVNSILQISNIKIENANCKY